MRFGASSNAGRKQKGQLCRVECHVTADRELQRWCTFARIPTFLRNSPFPLPPPPNSTVFDGIWPKNVEAAKRWLKLTDPPPTPKPLITTPSPQIPQKNSKLRCRESFPTRNFIVEIHPSESGSDASLGKGQFCLGLVIELLGLVEREIWRSLSA